MLTRIVCLSLCVIAVQSGCERKQVAVPADQMQADEVPAKETPLGTVTIEFVSAEQTNVVTVENVAEGTSLEEVMRNVKEVPIVLTGSGLTAFVKSIDGVATDHTQGWTYRVDGEHAHVGIGSLELHPPTTITWRFGAWDDDPAAK